MISHFWMSIQWFPLTMFSEVTIFLSLIVGHDTTVVADADWGWIEHVVTITGRTDMALYIIDAFYLLMLSISLILLWHSSGYHNGGHRIDRTFNPKWNQFPAGWSWIYRWWQVLAGDMFKKPAQQTNPPGLNESFARSKSVWLVVLISPQYLTITVPGSLNLGR